MATVYKFIDPGVPAYSFSTSQGSSLHFVALKTVLKACLVNGYGDKPPAGWELISEGNDWITLRNGSHSGYLHLEYYSNGASSRVNVVLAASFNGISAPSLEGDGKISGPVVGNSQIQRLLISQLAYSSAYHAWTVIADERSFVFSWACTTSDVPYGVNANGGSVSLYAGETTTGQFISLGGVSQGAVSGLVTRFDTSGMTWLTDPKSGLLVNSFSSGTVISHGRMLDGSSSMTYSLASPRQQLVSVNLYGALDATDELIYAGDLRGCCAIPNYTAAYSGALLRMLKPGTTGNYFGVMEALPAPFSDSGHEFFVRYNNAGSCSGLITDHPDYWL